ncbi:DUF3149 domain-containing protein [Paucibacter sp. KBW04]|uniref:DUF3149 domain-containing protein n=1 Tax=Paucibacter sp. KBW04 TaxID=2153361 RepID=UPI000F57E062|nr:DUF3149 domain-containing protein [Paucibacter sp. KBW04]RQO62490.1 DUF3149 domain-containing protein [Paucibacter sp. KBW04]
MTAWNVLFSTDVGLMSVAGLSITLGLGVFYLRYFLKHIKEDGERAAAAAARKP